jgi:hypothetical protein
MAALLVPLTFGCAAPLDPTTRPVLPVGDVSDTQPSGGADRAAAGAASQPGFYPLRVGNRWVYRQTSVRRIVPDVGDPPPTLMMESFHTREIDGVVELAGHEYLSELYRVDGDGGPFSWTTYLRQDAGGLYEFSAIRATPAAAGRATARARGRLAERAARLDAIVRPGAAAIAGWSFPATTGPYELLRLRYPLEPGTQWTVWSPFGPPVTAEVIGGETLELPAGRLRGYRIRISADVLGPNDRYEIWYGPSGYLKTVAHYEFPATDLGGNIVGREIFEQEETLQELRLPGSEVAALPPWLVRPRK